MADETNVGNEKAATTLGKGGAGSEHFTGRYGSRSEAESVVKQLTELGIPASGISVSEAAGKAVKRKLHIGEGLLVGLCVGGLLGSLFGAIFAEPGAVVTLMGKTYTHELAGAISGLGTGFAAGAVLGIILGALAKTATSPVFEFDELSADSALVEVQAPSTLAPRVREILNAS